MAIDNRTTGRNYPLPHPSNLLAEDVQRLRDALTAIDADVFVRYTKTEVDTLINNLISGAPGALNTLDELAAALGDDANFAATVTNLLALKADLSDVWTRAQADARYVQGVTQTENVFSGNGSQTSFTLTQSPPTRESLLVTVDGVVQPTSEYNLSGTTLTLSEAAANGAKIRVLMLGVAGPVQSASTLSFTQDGTSPVARTVASKLSEIVSGKDFGVAADGSLETTKVQNALSAVEPGELLHIAPGTRHAVSLSDRYHLGVDNRYTYNINTTTFSNSFNANVNAVNFDKQIYLFGDSHSWGQGSPEWDTFVGAADFSAHSANLYNLGFMARIEEFIKNKCNYDEKVYGTSVYIGNSLRYQPFDYIDSAGYAKQDLLFRPAELVQGFALSGQDNWLTATNSSYKGWYNPFATNEEAKINLYRDKIFAGKFGKNLVRIMPPETQANFHEGGKTEYLTLLPQPGIAATGGYSQVTDSNGNIIAEYNGSEFYLRVSAKTPYEQLGFFGTVGQSYFIPGYGKFVAGSKGGIAGDTAFAIRIYAANGVSYPSGLEKYLYANMRIYLNEYINRTSLRIDPEQPFRKLYLAIRKHSGGRKIIVGLQGSAFATIKYIPSGRAANALNSLAFASRPQWAFGKTGYPAVNIVTQNGGRISSTGFGVTVVGNWIEIDTYNATAGDVVYEIDYGSRVHVPVYIEDAGMSSNGSSANTESHLRGVVFNNNRVVNWAMGGHTIGQWMGDSASYNDGAYDHLADIIEYSTATPYMVITQLPLVNEYLRQTPIATFKSNIATFMSRLNGTLNAGGKVTDFLFFTTLGHKSTEFEGAASFAITYDMYVQAAKEQCLTSGAGFVDCRAMIKDMVANGLVDYNKLFNDNTHPGPFANELMARKVCSILDEVL